LEAAPVAAEQASAEQKSKQRATVPRALAGTEMAKINPFEFLQQVRAETSKVIWPTRRETLITTAMVFVFSIAAAIFFLVVDQVIRMALSFVLALLR
jgi:preprotein translocase subunit SecE